MPPPPPSPDAGRGRLAGEGEEPLAFELRDIHKAFRGTVAVRGVTVGARRGEIVGLVGRNGAGKSTLVKILAGVHRHGTFRGDLLVRGQPRRFASVGDAESAGVSLIPQELAVVPGMTVAENLFLNQEPTRFGLIDRGRMAAGATELLRGLGEDIAPATPMGRLSVAGQQIVEIARALGKNAGVLVLDEPTSSLSEREAARLFERLRELRARGLCGVYISHRIDEVREIADRVVVLRDGVVVREGAAGDLPGAEIVRLIVGRELATGLRGGRDGPAGPTNGGPTNGGPTNGGPTGGGPAGGGPKGGDGGPPARLEVRDWSVPDPHVRGRLRVDRVSFQVRPGEILGLFGAVGSGRTELLTSLVGAYAVRGSGALRVDGRPVEPRGPGRALRAGMVLVTEDRRQLGIEPFMSVGQNLTLAALGRFTRRGWIDRRQEADLMLAQLRTLQVNPPDPDASILALSGGNQQKVMLGRALLSRPRVLLLDEPTRGIDVGAKDELFAQLRALAAEGLAIVMVSSEAAEVLGVAHRVLVLRAGRGAGIHDVAGLTTRRLVALSSIGQEEPPPRQPATPAGHEAGDERTP